MVLVIFKENCFFGQMSHFGHNWVQKWYSQYLWIHNIFKILRYNSILRDNRDWAAATLNRFFPHWFLISKFCWIKSRTLFVLCIPKKNYVVYTKKILSKAVNQILLIFAYKEDIHNMCISFHCSCLVIIKFS